VQQESDRVHNSIWHRLRAVEEIALPSTSVLRGAGLPETSGRFPGPLPDQGNSVENCAKQDALRKNPRRHEIQIADAAGGIARVRLNTWPNISSQRTG